MPAIKKNKKVKKKRFAILLNERETEMLTRYARSHKCTRPMALRRIVKAALRDYAHRPADEVLKNQLNLFDVSHQTNLLDSIPKELK